MPKPIPPRVHARILALAAKGLSLRQIGRQLGIHETTVMRYARTPMPAQHNAPTALPRSMAEEYPPFDIAGPAKILLLSDIHIPFHDQGALSAALVWGRKWGPTCVLLNGDTLDFHQVSRYDHDGSKVTYEEEIAAGCQFLRHLRALFPKARMVFKEGNHEERLEKYILARAPALFGLEAVTVAGLLGLAGFGVEHVRDQRVIRCGKLRVIHGHEYGGGLYAPVNPARWLMQRARKPSIMGHLHQTSEQIEQDIDGRQLATWSVGCLSGLHPRYRRLSAKWNHGFAALTIHRDGSFSVENRRIIGGEVL